MTSFLWCLTFSHSLECIFAQMSKPGYSSSTVSLQPALRMILWEPYRKLSTKEKEKHYSAKIMTFSHFPLPLDENHIHLLSTTALRWSTDKKRIPKRKVGTIHSRESHRKPKRRQCWKEGNICSAWASEKHGDTQSRSKKDLLWGRHNTEEN